MTLIKLRQSRAICNEYNLQKIIYYHLFSIHKYIYIYFLTPKNQQEKKMAIKTLKKYQEPLTCHRVGSWEQGNRCWRLFTVLPFKV